MNFYVLNQNLETVAVIDTFSSMIWTTKYNDVGDFELYLPATDNILNALQKDYFVTRDDSDTTMIIKSIKVQEDEENGDYITITGKSLENLLSQRIVWNLTTLTGRVEDCIYQLIEVNCINPQIANRAIPNLILGKYRGFTEEYSGQFEGDNLLDIIRNLCKTFGLGFKLRLVGTNIVFSLYRGLDRSYNQSVNSWVVFSSDFDNLLSSDYTFNAENYKNVALVSGEGEGITKKYVSAGNGVGLDRYEIFVDSNVTSDDVGGDEVTYSELLRSKGKESLLEKQITEKFEASIDSDSYEYGVDYNLGDIVQVITKGNVTVSPRIATITENHDESGYKLYPTLEVE